MPVLTHARRAAPALLASTSVAALLMGGAPAFATCTDYINVTAAGCLNSVTISPSLTVSNSTVTSAVVNTGTITPNGVVIENNSALINGGFQSTGTIVGGFWIDQTSSITNISSGSSQGVAIGGNFTGNVSNGGTITVDRGSVNTGIVIDGTTFSGNVVNNGAINLGIHVTSNANIGIQVDNSGGMTTFAGGISNGGSITTRAINGNNCNSYGIEVVGGSGGTNLGLFSGGISNGGSITLATTGVFGINGVSGISVTDVTTFQGGIANAGTIAAAINGVGTQVAAGISVSAVTNFSGGITNGAGASVTAQVGAGSNSAGIFVSNVTSFQGGINNLGSITANTGILVTGSGPVGVFDSATIVGTGGVAVDLTGTAAGNTFTLGPGFAITGKVLGQGSDTFQLGGTGTGSFDLSTIRSTRQYQGFTSFNVVGGTWISSNTFGQSQTWNVNGGTLAGSGTFNALNINNGGTLMPGTPGVGGGKITVNGNLNFTSGATYAVSVSPDAAGTTAVTGRANLAGTITLIATGGQYSAKTYDILSATGGLNGTFSTVNVVGSFGALKPVLTYDDLFLTLVPNLLILPPGAPVNPTNVANAINTGNNNANGNIGAGLANLFNLSPAQLPAALTQLDGEVATGAQQGAFLLTDQFLELMLDPFVDGRSGSGWPFGGRSGGAMGFAPDRPSGVPDDVALAYARALKAPPGPIVSFDQRWSVWGAGFGGGANASGDAAIGSSNITAREYGYAGGVDYKLSPNSVVGFALAGGGTNWSLGQGLGTGRSDAFQGGVYGSARWGNFYVGADAAAGNHWMSTQRFALGDQLTANFNGQTYGVRAETGYRYALTPAIGVTPYAALQSQWFHTPNYSETDLTNAASGFALNYNGMTANDTKSELGARFDDRTMLSGMPLVLRARLAWAHDWVSNPAITAAFTGLPGSNFTVFGAALPHDSALTSLAAELHFSPNWTATAKFYGDFASNYQSYAGTGTLRYSW
jgi:uncharacterized protein with beta-barrel porin domain